MEDKNQLSDLMLDKKNSSKKNNKKMILAIATLGVILIIVILLMNSLNSDSKNNLPQTVLPPKPTVEKQKTQAEVEEPMFEDAEVIDEGNIKDDSAEKQKLEKIAKELKEQSGEKTIEKTATKTEPKITPTPIAKTTKQQPKKQIAKKTTKHQSKQAIKGRYYIQVGSFSKYSPDKKYLNSIKRKGYNYKFHKTTVHGKHITKLLIGPYSNRSEAKKALRNVKRTLQKGAFIIKI